MALMTSVGLSAHPIRKKEKKRSYEALERASKGQSLAGPRSHSSCGSIRGCLMCSLCGLLPPRRHRLLVLLLLAAGAYCLLLHRQRMPSMPPPPPPHLALSTRGNRSRALAGLRENSNASLTIHRLKEGGGGVDAAEAKSEEGATYLTLHTSGGGGNDEGGGEGEEGGDDSEKGTVGGRESEIEEELSRRRARVWEVCKANGLVGEEGESIGEPNAWEFFIDERHHLVWCNIFKAASSSWMYNFNLLGGYKEGYLRKSRKSPLTLARARFPRPSVEQLKEALPRSLSFLIVRDPFERLLSAYRNKIEGFRHKFYRKMAREMISRFRVKTTPAPGTHKNSGIEKSPTFSEFVSWVIASAKKATGTEEGGYNGIPGFDEHWAPYFRFCTPCAVNFTVIAKMETLAYDEDYIIQKSGIGSALGRTRQGIEVGARPREAVNAAIGGRTEDLLPRYFRTLNREQLDALYEIYRIDFLMFGYDATKYYETVKL